jgi:hypothetical protein
VSPTSRPSAQVTPAAAEGDPGTPSKGDAAAVQSMKDTAMRKCEDAHRNDNIRLLECVKQVQEAFR